MNEIHLTNIYSIESNTHELPFAYKPDVPKLKMYADILVRDAENELEESKGIVFLTQKQLNQIINGKGIEIEVDTEHNENRWKLKHPLSKEQKVDLSLIQINASLVGTINDLNAYEVHEVLYATK